MLTSGAPIVTLMVGLQAALPSVSQVITYSCFVGVGGWLLLAASYTFAPDSWLCRGLLRLAYGQSTEHNAALIAFSGSLSDLTHLKGSKRAQVFCAVTLIFLVLRRPFMIVFVFMGALNGLLLLASLFFNGKKAEIVVGESVVLARLNSRYTTPSVLMGLIYALAIHEPYLAGRSVVYGVAKRLLSGKEVGASPLKAYLSVCAKSLGFWVFRYLVCISLRDVLRVATWATFIGKREQYLGGTPPSKYLYSWKGYSVL